MPTVAFDLNGTLLDPGALAEPLAGDDRARGMVLESLDKAVAQAMALTITGDYRPFSELVEAALARALEVSGGDPAKAEEAVGRAQQMPPFPEAPAALQVLQDAGFRLAVLTNSATEDAEAALDNAGLADRFDLVLGTDAVGAFKPDGRVYRAAVERLDAAPADVWLVAAHWWDVHGARSAGLRGAWVARKEQVLLSTVDADATGEDLLAVARALTSA